MKADHDSPTIAVVIPVYCGTEKHEVYLSEALASVAGQTYRDFEVLIVDDLSPRDITPIVGAVSGLPRVRVIRNETNLGHAASRNVGVLATSAPFIAFLDHDDLWEPSKLEKQLQVIQANPDAGMVFCRVEVFGPYASRLGIDQSRIPERPSILWFFYHGNYVITASAALVRRDALLDIGLFDTRYSTSDDFDAWLKIVETRPIISMSECLAKYRLHSMNANYGVDRYNDTRLLFALYRLYWWRAPLAIRLVLLPRLAKKLMGEVYYSIFRHQRLKG